MGRWYGQKMSLVSRRALWDDVFQLNVSQDQMMHCQQGEDNKGSIVTIFWDSMQLLEAESFYQKVVWCGSKTCCTGRSNKGCMSVMQVSRDYYNFNLAGPAAKHSAWEVSIVWHSVEVQWICRSKESSSREAKDRCGECNVYYFGEPLQKQSKIRAFWVCHVSRAVLVLVRIIWYRQQLFWKQWRQN